MIDWNAIKKENRIKAFKNVVEDYLADPGGEWLQHEIRSGMEAMGTEQYLDRNFKITPHPTQSGAVVLTIDGEVINDWGGGPWRTPLERNLATSPRFERRSAAPDLVPSDSRRDPSIKALYSLVRVSADPEDILYFVNHTDEILTRVGNVSTGVFSDDDTVHSTSESRTGYDDVKPNEAVKVDMFDGFYDLDFLIVNDIEVLSPSKGRLVFRVVKKGGTDGAVLLWSDNRVPRKVLLIDSPNFTPEPWE